MSKTITIINLDKKVNTAVVEFLVNLSPETSNQKPLHDEKFKNNFQSL